MLRIEGRIYENHISTTRIHLERIPKISRINGVNTMKISKVMEYLWFGAQLPHQNNMQSIIDQLDNGEIDLPTYFKRRNEELQDWLSVAHNIDCLIESGQITFSRNGRDYPYTIEEGVEVILEELNK